MVRFVTGQVTRCEEKAHEGDKYGLIVSADDPQLFDKLNHGAKEGNHLQRLLQFHFRIYAVNGLSSFCFHPLQV